MRHLFLLLTCASLLVGHSVGAVCSGPKHPGITAIAMKDTVVPSDPLSFRWWFHFRDTVDKSARYCLVDPPDSYLMLSVTGLDTDPKNLVQDRAAVSFAAYFTGNTVFIKQWLHVCEAGRVDECAESALAEIEHELQVVPDALKPKE